MNESHGIVNVSRRELLKGGAALTLAVMAGCGRSGTGTQAAEDGSPVGDSAASSPVGDSAASSSLEPNAFVRIGSDSSVTVISKHLEMGQGAYTGLATLVAEELDADWSQVSVTGAPADAKRYANLNWGGSQGTGGSDAIFNSFEQYRTAGAAAHAMLVNAAANRWGVAAKDIRISRGAVSHAASGRQASFGELAAEAAKLPVPAEIKLKEPKDFVYIGKTVRRTDALAKSTGRAQYTQDVQLPGMLTAVVAHPPRFGATLGRFDAAKAMAIAGVVQVVAFHTPATVGVAVLAKDFWTAKRGRDALSVEWDESAAFKKGTAEMLSEYRQLARKPGLVARDDGKIESALAGAVRTLEATYELPYLAHASMEPLNCVAQVHAERCEIWNAVQSQSDDQARVAAFLKLPPEKVKLNMLYAGGSFGRRAAASSDYVLEAVAIAKAAGGGAPVKLVWTREDDMRAGFYRPMFVHQVSGGLDQAGNILAWRHRIVGQSIMASNHLSDDEIDPESVAGAATLPYSIANLRVELHSPMAGPTVQWWRSVGHSHTAFATECFIDELAHAAGKDPLELRRSLLSRHPRHRAVLELAAQKADWGRALPEGRARGIAVHESFKSYVAQVAEVARTPSGFKLERVVCAVDCGLAVNPDIIAMQMESGIAYGLPRRSWAPSR